MWTNKVREQHIRNKLIVFLPNEELTVENDDIQNSFGKHENGQAIPEYDPTWFDTDENESYSSDENEEYTEPTCSDSDLDVKVG